MAQAFDTLAAARDLEAAGIDRQQAEAIAGAIRNGQGDLVTKADLAATKADLEAAIARMERRLMLYGLALAGVLFAAIKYL